MKYAIVVACLAVTGCHHTLKAAAPIKTARFQIPEVSERLLAVRGQWTFEEPLGVAIIHDVTADDPQPGDGWDITTHTEAWGPPFALDLGVTVFPQTELGVSQHVGELLSRISLKHQFHGAGRESSVPGNVSYALAATYGYDDGETSGGSTGVSWTVDYKSRTLDLGLIAGYRATRRTLFFGGPFIARHAFRTTLQRSDEVTGSEYFHRSDTLWVHGANVGVEFGYGRKRTFVLAVELNTQWMSWDRVGFSDPATTAGLMMGAQF